MSSFETGEKPTILVVDNTPDNLILVSNLLKKDYRVRVAISGEKALKIALSESPPDMILQDVMMPVMDGYEVCQQLRNHEQTAHIPIIFLTTKSEVEDERKGLSLGASDYITKPISPPILEARVKTHLVAKAHADFLTDKTAYLEDEVARRTRELTAIQDLTIQAMASLAETWDSDTDNHIRRTQFYVKALTSKLQKHPRFAAF
jgi:putative two-component system response regulator